jgi:hypothetical protein
MPTISRAESGEMEALVNFRDESGILAWDDGKRREEIFNGIGRSLCDSTFDDDPKPQTDATDMRAAMHSHGAP